MVIFVTGALWRATRLEADEAQVPVFTNTYRKRIQGICERTQSHSGAGSL